MLPTKELTYEEILAVTCKSLSHMKYYIYLLAAINILLAITASLGNALILAALQRETSLFPPTKLMFKCLAVTDFCVGVFVQPLFVIQLLSTANEHRQLCYTVVSIIETLGGSFFGVALLTLIAISVDRLLALSLGLRYRQAVTLRRIRATLICFWIFNISVSILRFFWQYVLITTVISAVIYSSLAISFFSYLKIYLTLRQHYATQDVFRQRQPNGRGMHPPNMARYKKTVTTAICVQLAMLACYLPYGIISSMQYDMGYSPSLHLATLLVGTLGPVNSSLNPILYCWRINGVRRAVQDILKQMTNQPNATTVCGLPVWVAFPANNSASYMNDALAVAANVPLSIFAFLSNLAIIVTIVKTPTLQRPSHVFLCSLAAADCLTAMTSQPLFFIWRLMLHRARQSCDFQIELFESRYVFNTFTTGGSFAILTLISFDRARALANPMAYRAQVSKKDAAKATIITGTAWLLLTILIHFILPGNLGYILQLTSAMLFILLPVINHIRMFLAIRRHNNQIVGQVDAQQLSVIFRREKKVAVDMAIVVVVLVACLGPMLVIKLILQSSFPKIYDVLYPWAFTMTYLNSSINPFLYLIRNEELRSALRLVVSPCF
ncbi:uncharacterized protein LOC144628177 [Oculina patagonica]